MKCTQTRVSVEKVDVLGCNKLVTIYMFYVICLCILHYAPPKYVLHWKFCYIYLLSRGDSYTSPELHLRFYVHVFASYYGVCISIFVYVIQSNCCLYFILGIFLCISPVYGLYHHCTIIKSVFVLICLGILYLYLLR